MADEPIVQADTAPAAGEQTAAEAALAEQQTRTAEPPTTPKAAPAEADDDGGEDEGTGKKPSRSQRLQRKVQLLTAELDSVRRQPEARPQQDAPAQRSDADPKPKEEDFKGDYLAYERELTAWNVKQATRAAVREFAENERAQRTASQQAESRREAVIAHIERVEDLKERVPDFDTVMKEAATISLRDEVAAEILGSEKSALIQYHLAKNPEKARDLNGLTGRELARAVGRLEGAVRLPAAKKATDATPPVQPLTGAASPSFDPIKSDMGDYAANYRARQEARDKRRFG